MQRPECVFKAYQETSHVWLIFLLSPLPLLTPQERAKPSLHARCFLRLGMYEWHHSDAAEQHLAHCMELLRVSGWSGGVTRCPANVYCPVGDKVENPASRGSMVQCGSNMVTRSTEGCVCVWGGGGESQGRRRAYLSRVTETTPQHSSRQGVCMRVCCTVGERYCQVFFRSGRLWCRAHRQQQIVLAAFLHPDNSTISPSAPPLPPVCATQAATEYGANWPKAWHHWALFNCGLLEALVKAGDTAAARGYVAPAVTGFFRRYGGCSLGVGGGGGGVWLACAGCCVERMEMEVASSGGFLVLLLTAPCAGGCFLGPRGWGWGVGLRVHLAVGMHHGIDISGASFALLLCSSCCNCVCCCCCCCSVALGQAAGDRTGNLQDVLRLLTLWFTWGSAPDVETALNEGFALVSIDTWLGVIPQIIARIHTNNPQVRTGRGGGTCTYHTAASGGGSGWCVMPGGGSGWCVKTLQQLKLMRWPRLLFLKAVNLF